MKDIENWPSRQDFYPPDPFKQKDTTTVWGIIGPPIKMVFCIIAGFVLLAYWPYVSEWMDRVLDKSDQMRTGVWILGIGSVTFIVLFFTGCLKR